MKKIQRKAKVVDTTHWIELEFGATQMELEFSNTGLIQRTLRLKKGDEVIVTLEKV